MLYQVVTTMTLAFISPRITAERDIAMKSRRQAIQVARASFNSTCHQATPISIASISSLYPPQMSMTIKNRSDRRHFDLDVVEDIRRDRGSLIYQDPQGETWLDLDGFDTYTEEAVTKLVQTCGEFTGFEIGFRTLSPETAKIFAAFRTEYFVMTNLISLEASAAQHLTWCPNWTTRIAPFRSFAVQEPLSAESAAALVIEGKDAGPLKLIVPTIDVDVATILARHNCSLILNLRTDFLSPKVAEALAHHVGSDLEIILPGMPTNEVMVALACNPLKRIRGAAVSGVGRIYVKNYNHWNSFYDCDDVLLTTPCIYRG